MDGARLRSVGARVRRAGGDLLPEKVRYVLWQRVAPRAGLGRLLGHTIPEPLDLRPLRLLRESPAEKLLDPAGLEPVLLELGLNEDVPYPKRFEPFMGRGLRYAQYPNQLAPYLIELLRHEISSYLEIGVQHGGTFLITTEYLRRFGSLEAAVGLDVFRVPSLENYARERADVRILRADSTSRRVRRWLDGRHFDLVLIDGDHSEDGCWRDYLLVRDHAGAVAFHDVVGANTPGVRAVWNRLKRDAAAEYDFQEFTAQYPEVEEGTQERYLGIGLAVRKKPGKESTAAGRQSRLGAE